eukprot:1159478-Pelagomonas_calceolata.AAC.1
MQVLDREHGLRRSGRMSSSLCDAEAMMHTTFQALVHSCKLWAGCKLGRYVKGSRCATGR